MRWGIFTFERLSSLAVLAVLLSVGVPAQHAFAKDIKLGGEPDKNKLPATMIPLKRISVAVASVAPEPARSVSPAGWARSGWAGATARPCHRWRAIRIDGSGRSLMEAQDDAVYRLTDEQVAEVERRRADKNAKRLTLDEFNARLRRLTGE